MDIRVDRSASIVGIIGTGKMGTELAYYFASRQVPVVWLGKAGDSREQRRARRFRQRAERSGFPVPYVGSDYSRLSRCDVAIEAITEDIHRKRTCFQAIAPYIKDSTVIASASSSLIPSRISTAEQSVHVGLHFFSPVAQTQVVEWVPNPRSDPDRLHYLEAFMQSLGFSILRVPEEHPFPVNRIFLDVQADAYRMVVERMADIDSVDSASMQDIYSYGIFAMIDLAGVDVVAASVREYVACESEEDRAYYEPFYTRLRELIAQGCLGTKTGQGFFTSEEDSDQAGTWDATDRYAVRLRLAAVYFNAYKRCMSRFPFENLQTALRLITDCDLGPSELPERFRITEIDRVLKMLYNRYGFSQYRSTV